MTFEYLETHPNIIITDMFGTLLYQGDWVLFSTGGRYGGSGACVPDLARLHDIIIKPKTGKDLKLYPSLNIINYDFLFNDNLTSQQQSWMLHNLKKEHNNYSNLSKIIDNNIQVYKMAFAKVDYNVNEKLKDKYKELIETE